MLVDTKSSRAKLKQVLVVGDDVLIAMDIDQTLLEPRDINVAVARTVAGNGFAYGTKFRCCCSRRTSRQ